MIRVINIKEGGYPDVAAAMLLIEIDNYKSTDLKVIVAVHGYGSSGVGGEIKKEVKNQLFNYKRKKKIIDFIPGESWSENHKHYKELIAIEPELILNNQVSNFNSGVTIVWIKK